MEYNISGEFYFYDEIICFWMFLILIWEISSNYERKGIILKCFRFIWFCVFFKYLELNSFLNICLKVYEKIGRSLKYFNNLV